MDEFGDPLERLAMRESIENAHKQALIEDFAYDKAQANARNGEVNRRIHQDLMDTFTYGYHENED